MNDDQSLCELVRSAENDYVYNTTTMGKYVQWSMHDTIERIDAYLNSKHISGDTDSLGREKPFFNIVTAATNIWYRATDIDRKDIRFIPQSAQSIPLAFVANVMLQNWMDDNRFGVFLNEWGRSLARYGSSVVKFVEQNGKLIPSVIPWNRIITDPVDFNALPVIEKFYKTEAQLYKMVRENGYDKDAVEKLCNAVKTRKTLDGQTQDNNSNFIELYEINGELSRKIYNQSKGLEVKEEDDDVFFEQMHVVSFVKKGSGDGEGYQDFTLFSGKSARNPYMLTHLIKEDGRTLAIGSVEYLFDSQWMQNHTMKNMKDTLDLSSKLIFQTADSSYVGRNVLSAIETGDIMIFADNKPLTQINNSKADVTALQNFSGMWNQVAQNITSTPDAIRGNTMPSGTPYSLAAYSGAQANNLFEQMTENKGLALEDMLTEFVIPNLKRRLKNKDEVVAILDDAGIQELDAMYLPKAAINQHNQEFKKAILSGEIPSPYQPDVAQAQLKQDMTQLGNKRFFKPDELDEMQWKEVFSDFEWDSVKVEVTNENADKQAILTTLDSTFKTVASLAGRPMTPDERLIFSTILTETGRVSPLQLASTPPQVPPVPTASPPVGTEAALPTQQ